VSDNANALCNNVFGKITRIAKDLRKVSGDLAGEFGIPIVNNRIAVTPISLIAGKTGHDGLLKLARTLDRAARELEVDFIGGFSAHVEKGMAPIDAGLIAALPHALAATERVCASVNVGTTRAGLNMDAIAEMGRVVKETAAATAARDSIGCAKL